MSDIRITTEDSLAIVLTKLDELSRKLDGATIIPAPEWISIEALAEKEGVSTATVRRWIREGKLETKGVGGKRKVKA